MKKILLVLLTLAFCSTIVQAKQPSKPTNFSGNWVLSFGQTKNPPAGLQRYSMVVNQDEQQLKVDTSLEGDLQATPNTPNSGGYPGGSTGGYPGGRRGGMGGGMGMPGGIGMGMPGGGMGMPRGGGGRPRTEGPSSQGNVAAYKLYPQSAVYKLDGSESTVQLGDPEQTNATSKAEREKNGEVLKLSLVGNGDSGQRGGKIQVKEEWKLSEDGKSLRVDRSIKSPEGSGTAHLVFLKREADSSSGATPEPQ
ncbi:MAG: hypothetical protein ABSH01_09560 [Terriglobia bacterium]|jgi:hypothetical protein